MTKAATAEITDEVNRQVGSRLRKFRSERGLSQTKIGDWIGVSFQQIGKYERGENAISIAAVIVLCRALNVKPIELLEDLLDS